MTQRLRVWTDSDGCSGCKFCGMDMDMDPYCVHPTLKAEHPDGLNIGKAIQRFCGDNTGKLTLWEKRPA